MYDPFKATSSVPDFMKPSDPFSIPGIDPLPEPFDILAKPDFRFQQVNQGLADVRDMIDRVETERNYRIRSIFDNPYIPMPDAMSTEQGLRDEYSDWLSTLYRQETAFIELGAKP